MGDQLALGLADLLLHLFRQPAFGHLLLPGDGDIGLLELARAAIDTEGIQAPKREKQADEKPTQV